MNFKSPAWLYWLLYTFVWIGLVTYFASYVEVRRSELMLALVSMNPISLLLIGLLMLAHGEWLYGEIQAFRLDRDSWLHARLNGLEKLLFTAVALGSLGLLLWVMEGGQIPGFSFSEARGLAMKVLKAVLLVVIFSAISLVVYSLHRAYKKKRLPNSTRRG